MMIKQLLRHTNILLRTALLLGAATFVNVQQAEGQTAAQWAQMPDAFETMDPASIIGDGNYYYIQFYQAAHDKCSYLTDCGVNQRAQTRDFLPYANNRLWTLVAAGDGNSNHFKLRSKTGRYVKYGSFSGGNRFGCVEGFENATILTFHVLDDGYDISQADDEGYPMYRPSYNEWTDLAKAKKYSSSQSYNLDLFRLRFVKLKSNAAFIIYYRGEGVDNTTPGVETTRHYLTYSGTGNQVSSSGTLQTSDVSSRLSIIPKDKPLSSLPTLAAYHKDGLWTLEESGDDGGFYIKKYGTNDYLINSSGNYSILGAKDVINAKYKVENTGVNRYTPIQKVNYEQSTLTSDMFKNWNGYGGDATYTGDAGVDFNIGNNATINGNGMVAGTSTVNRLIYADLSEYSKMIINGTQEMKLRVLLSRQEGPSNNQSEGPLVEKNVTIGGDGTAVVDLTNLQLNSNHSLPTQTTTAKVKMTYINGDTDAVSTSYGEIDLAVGTPCGYHKIQDGTVELNTPEWGENDLPYLQVDATAISGTITKVTLTGEFSGNSNHELYYGVGYNDSEWSSTLKWNTPADRSITTIGGTQEVGKNVSETTLSFDITDAFKDRKKRTILIYKTYAYQGWIKNPRVEVEYTPRNSDVNINFAHLNAIKTASDSPAGTISSITLLKETTGARYLHYSKGDGWQVEQWTQKHEGELWDAAFYPVEVPDPNQDDFYQVLLKVKKADPTKIKLTGATNNPTITPLSGSTLDNLYGATFTPTADLTNVFKIENMPTGCYEKIVIKFGSAVPSGWNYHAYGPQGDYHPLEGMTQLEITLDPERTIDDFTIFNWFNIRSSITIKEVYFTPASPDCDLVEMLNHEGNTDAYSETPGLRKTWHLQQVDNYEHFRLMAPNGQYFQADGKMTSDVNSAKIFTNTSLLERFDLKWFYINVAKETYVDYMITHRQSYLKEYATQHANLDLGQQGLATEVQSDWWNYDFNTQKVNHFEITHYVRRGETKKVEFPTILNNSSDHIYYQRWYHFAEKDDENTPYTDGTDIEGFKTHVSLDTPENQEVQYYVYKNGIVTGEKLYWEDDIGLQRHANRNFNFYNHDGKSFTVAADVSRYSDFTYVNESSKLEGNLVEPSLTMRYIYYMNDAKEMAKKLTAKTFKGFDFIDSKEGLNFLEAKTFHFPARQIFYENQKKCGYRGEFIGLRHLFSDYWVFIDGNPNSTDDNNLMSAVNDDNTGGKIEVRIYDPNETGIRLGGYNPNMTLAERDGFTDGTDADYQGFYFYDMMDLSYGSNNTIHENKMSYGDSRFVVFRYPSGKQVTVTNKPVYINVYFKANDNTRYQLAQFTIIFDDGTVTLPYTSVNSSPYVKSDNSNTNQKYKDRDPKNLINKAGKPIAKITFDYPMNDTYHYPSKGETRHNQQPEPANGTIANSSPIPLTFGNTNYAFDGDGCNWGSYAMVSQMGTANGNNILAVPANDITYGYGPTDSEIANNPQLKSLRPDDGLQNGFLYIDASEQPGDICSAPFVGDFCANDKLMFSGWISGSNKAGAGYNRCPGGVTLTVKGERNKHDENGRIVYDENGIPKKETVTLYRFCPGQIYELDNGSGDDGSTGATGVVWQQFYFEFIVTDKYDHHWIEVNNNCVSSRGGDFMLDNIEVYAVVPEVIPGMNTPLCVSVNDNGEEVTDMRLLKLSVDFNKLKTASNVNENSTGASELGFIFLDKKVFLETFKTELQKLTNAEKEVLHLQTFNFQTISLDQLEDAIEDGELSEIKEVEEVYAVQEGQPGYEEYFKYLAHYKAFEIAYHNAFDAAILGEKKTWHSNNPTVNSKNASVMYFEWKHQFDAMENYSFAKAVSKTHPVYRETSADGEKFVVMNGNYPELSWKTNTDYYIITTNQTFESMRPFVVFNLCSECNKASVFRIDPPYEILGLEKSEETNDYVVCEGQIPTLLTDLKGYDLEGKEVAMKDLNFDWWLGDPANGVLATLENYHNQNKSGIRLDQALSTLRAYYPDITDLDDIKSHQATGSNSALTIDMVDYLKDLVEAGQLVLHQKSISIPAVPAGEEDPYFYLVACPIHDGYFDKALNPGANKFVSYFCDEPQGLRVRVGEKAPTLKTGFVPDQNGFASYNYSAVSDAVLSIRLAKKAQFATVQHGSADDYGNNIHTPDNTSATDTHFLWLPIRNAFVQTTESEMVIQKTNDENIYLASTNDPVWDKLIYTAMNRYDATTHEHTGSLPVVGKIVQLNAIDVAKNVNSGKQEKDHNRLCVYFTNNFEVREGYSYTLSLPFKESPGENTCDGTILINLKIVPDYEVWTGGADNTDWNNDDNWRRADGNTVMPTTEPTDESKRNNNELLVSNTLPTTSGLYQYETNYWNYRTPKDRILRKGFAPLYCTHILMKSNEWGDAPVLYDALAGKTDLDAYPFPNLTDSYTTNTVDYIDQKYETIEAIGNNSFAIFNEADSRLIYGTDNQNLGYNVYDIAVQSTNSGYYFKLESVPGGYLLRLYTPDGNPYTIWGSQGYLNSQPASETVSFILGLTGQQNQYTYGQDGDNLALWTLETDADHPGKFALRNVGTGGYLKNNSVAKYEKPTYFTFCTLKKEESTTSHTKFNILKYDMQARLYDIWADTYGSAPDRGRPGDLIAEMYQINSCDEIAFQPSAELLNAHLLNYNNAWVEYQLDNNRWYLLGSPLQGTISGEWYAPTGTAQQKTTYYENVTFGAGYDRYSPAIYQRSWDKAKAVLYEIGADYAAADDDQTQNLGTPLQGAWGTNGWNDTGADRYLDRLGYKPMGGKKANVAMKGIWSNTYNDAAVDYTQGGFSVMVKNDLKGGSNANPAIIRLPKEDTMYDYYEFSQTGANDGGTDTELSTVQSSKNRAKNRGRLKSDLLLPKVDATNVSNTYQQIQRTETTASRYGDMRTYTRVPTQPNADYGLPIANKLNAISETVSPGISNLGYYLVENPFVAGLDMTKFFEVNTGLEKKYWILTASGQQLVQLADAGTWIKQENGTFTITDAKVAPGQGFFVQATTPGEAATISFTADMQAKTRYGVKSGEETFTIVVGTKQRMTTKEETITLEDGTTKTVTVEVPEVDDSGNYVVEDITDNVTISTYAQATGDGNQFPLKSRATRSAGKEPLGMVITAQRGGLRSSALVMQRSEASNDFMPEEDTEVFLNSDLKQVPTVYTLCGRLATTVNSIREFRTLPLGVESASDAPCLLTFRDVEELGDSVALYDAVEKKLTPLESGMTVSVSGQTQNRYYLVRSLSMEEAAEETHLQIFTEGMTARVIASTQEPVVSVRCYDMAGRLIHKADPQMPEYSFSLPRAGIYIIEAETENDHKVKKVMTK